MEGHTHFSPDKQGGGHGLTETNLGRGVHSAWLSHGRGNHFQSCSISSGCSDKINATYMEGWVYHVRLIQVTRSYGMIN